MVKKHLWRYRLPAMVLLALVIPSVHGVVLFPGDTGLTDKPNDNFVGLWYYYDTNSQSWLPKASAVAIGPNQIITTRHQGGGVGTIIKFGGVEYRVAEQTNNGSVDMRILRIETLDGRPANLTEFAPIYTTSDEVEQTAAMGGFGGYRGGDLTVSGTVYGYQWVNTLGTERWGANLVDTTYSSVISGSYNSQCLHVSFERAGTGAYVDHEASLAIGDSGGGWFIKNGSTWYLAGLSAYVSHNEGQSANYQTWFRKPTDPFLLIDYPDKNYSIRVSAYVPWITSTQDLYFVMPGDANWDGKVDLADLSVLATNYGLSGKTWTQADFTADTDVGLQDLSLLATNYGYGTGGGTAVAGADFSASGVPEPASLTILALGLVGLWRRR